MATTLKEWREAERQRRKELKFQEVIEKKRLINEVYKHPCIWDRRETTHGNRALVEEAWQIIATTLDLDRDLARRHWKHFMDHFRLKHNEIKNSRRRGNGLRSLEKAMSIKWPYYKSLMFLKDVISTRQPSPSVEDVQVEQSTDIPVHEDILTEDKVCQEIGPEDEPCTVPKVRSPSTSSLVEDPQGAHSTDMHEDMLMEDRESQEIGPEDEPCSVEMSVARKMSYGKPRYNNSKKRAREIEGVELAIDLIKKRHLNDDETSHFLLYLGDLIRNVPEDKQQKCKNVLLEVTNLFLEGEEPIAALPYGGAFDKRGFY